MNLSENLILNIYNILFFFCKIWLMFNVLHREQLELSLKHWCYCLFYFFIVLFTFLRFRTVSCCWTRVRRHVVFEIWTLLLLSCMTTDKSLNLWALIFSPLELELRIVVKFKWNLMHEITCVPGTNGAPGTMLVLLMLSNADTGSLSDQNEQSQDL